MHFDNPVIHLFDAQHFTGNIIFNGAFFTPPSIEHNTSRCFLCVYRTTPSIQDWYDSSIRIITVYGENKELLVPVPHTDRLLVAHGEDPRVLALTNRHLLVTYTDVNRLNTRATIKGQVFLADYIKNEYKLVKQLTFDLNCSGQDKQKNWNFFLDPYTQHVLLIYRIMPFELYDLGHINHVLFAPDDLYEKESHVMECMLRTSLVHRQFWKHPFSDILLLRGGTNPVYIREGEFYLFVHSGTYKMFCLVMTRTEKNKKWHITKVGNRPIVYHDMDTYKHQVHFPVGGVYDATKRVFHVCLGLEDQNLGYVVLDKSWVDAHLEDVEDIVPPTVCI